MNFKDLINSGETNNQYQKRINNQSRPLTYIKQNPKVENSATNQSPTAAPLIEVVRLEIKTAKTKKAMPRKMNQLKASDTSTINYQRKGEKSICHLHSYLLQHSINPLTETQSLE